MEELINPHFRTGKASGQPSWPHAQPEGGSSLEMVVVELSTLHIRGGPDFKRHSGVNEAAAWQGTDFILLRKTLPTTTTNVKKEQVRSSALHCPTLLSRQETRNPPKPLYTGRAAHALLGSACNIRLTGIIPRLLLLDFCIQELLKRERYNLRAMGTQTHSAPSSPCSTHPFFCYCLPWTWLGSPTSVPSCPFLHVGFLCCFC